MIENYDKNYLLAIKFTGNKIKRNNILIFLEKSIKMGRFCCEARPGPHLRLSRSQGLVCSYYLRLSSNSFASGGVVIRYDVVVVGI